ncbi:MAG: endonuclease/exonuclease/phosphatase family protein [Chloroflexi bacterium]|nr:endonuclease/exonuclease/phosphatase family protein [Chloroflexota bacterium]
MTRLQIVSANIGGHRHLNNQPLDTTQVARDVRGILPIDPAQPTIIALQETTSVWRGEQRWSDGAALAALLGADYRFFFAPEVDSQNHAHQRIWQRPLYQGYTRVENGNGIITNLARAAWPWPLPGDGYPGSKGAEAISASISHARLYSSGSRDTQPRNAILFPAASDFGTVYFMNTHWSTRSGEERHNPEHPISQRASEERLFETQQILLLVEELRAAERAQNRAPCPIILAGDFNAAPDTAEMRALETVFRRLIPVSPDYTHIVHKIPIDHILIADPSGLLPVNIVCRIHTAPEVAEITDHRPVLAVIEQASTSTV